MRWRIPPDVIIYLLNMDRCGTDKLREGLDNLL